MLRAALTLLAPLLGAAALIAWSAWQLNEPSDLDEVAAWIDSLARPGDLVVVAPADRVLDLRYFDEQDALAASTLPPEVDRFERVFLVRNTSDTPPSIQRMLGGRGRLVLSDTFGGQQVELFQLRPSLPLVADLSAHIADATVHVEPDDGSAPVECPWNGDRFQCGDADWTYVGLTQQTFEGQPHTCVWSHPIDEATLVIEFHHLRNVERLTGWYGLTDYAVSIPDGRRVTLSIEAGDTSRRLMARQIRGRTPIDMPIRGGDDTTVRLEVTSQSPGVRHLCWELQALGGGAPPSRGAPPGTDEGSR